MEAGGNAKTHNQRLAVCLHAHARPTLTTPELPQGPASYPAGLRGSRAAGVGTGGLADPAQPTSALSAAPWTPAAGLRGGGAGQAEPGAHPESDPFLTRSGASRPSFVTFLGKPPRAPAAADPGPGGPVDPSTCPEVCVRAALRLGSGGLRRAESVSRSAAASVCGAANPRARLL